jgi:hypothetical protein
LVANSGVTRKEKEMEMEAREDFIGLIINGINISM